MPLQGRALDLAVYTDNPLIDQDSNLCPEGETNELLGEHLLARLLRKMG